MGVFLSLCFIFLFLWFVSKDGKDEAAGTLGCMGIIVVAFVVLIAIGVAFGIMLSMATT